MKRKNNNRGFTLVELIIAIAILAIAVSPLVLNFMQSSQLNLKGRKSLNAMNLAQDVMEGLSAYTPSELETILNNMNKEAANRLLSGQTADQVAAYCEQVMCESLLPAGASIDQVKMETQDVDTPLDGVIDKYVYTLKGVQTASSNYAKYDMVLTMDSSSTSYDDFNGKEVAEFVLLDPAKDGSYTVPDAEVSTAIDFLHAQSSKKEVPKESYKDELVRTIEVNIVNKGTDPNPKYVAEVRTSYHIRDSKKSDFGVDSASPYINVVANIVNGDQTKVPRSVYINYKGIERSATVDLQNVADVIKVNNRTGEKVTAYLFRIQDSTGKSNTTYNSNYKCSVELVSKEPGIAGVNNEDLDVVTNLRFDLSKDADKNVRATDESDQPITGVAAPEGNGYSRTRASYKYNGTAISEAMYQKHIQDGYRKGKKNILFTVNMDLYEPTDGAITTVGTTKKVATYTGGMSN